ncbi:MAG TPA: pantoate--beta-alanine ligase [Candidatus Acidoferrum sp.]|nr:pantoate--beta-alanine ligase [Candidatus Acidoferrum sp.]
MLHIETLSELESALTARRQHGSTIGLVPTMGNLHAGHLSLVQAAKAQCDFVITTIFVNPLQFGPSEDFSRYPRTLDADKQLLTAAGCDAVFTPTVTMLYPTGIEQQTRISVPFLSTLYCGKTRPGHFDGVCTIVCKLFNMTRPDIAFFGLKDFQQFFLIKRMVTDLQMPLQLVGLPTVREASGLAMSSRNGYLTGEQREQAAAVYATLQHGAYRLQGGMRDFAAVEQEARDRLESAGLRPDYFSVVDAATLLPAGPGNKHLVLLTAAWAGTTRLIDNLTVDLV